MNEFNNNENNKLKKLIVSKILIQLVNYYPNANNYNKNIENELKIIKEKNINLINDINNVNFFKEIKLNYDSRKIILKNIEEIYKDIIFNIIKYNKFEDIENIIDNLNQLDIEKIDIFRNNFNELSKILNPNENIINQYIINDINDLFKVKNINFYYILFKYILKNSMYIYQIDFLYKNRKKILQNIKEINLEEYENKIKDEKLKEKFEYFFRFIIDSDYYLKNNFQNKKSEDTNKTNDNTENNYKNPKINDLNNLISVKDNYNSQTTDSPSISTYFYSYNNSEYSYYIQSLKDENKEESLKDFNIYDFIKKILKFSIFLFYNDENQKINYYLLDDNEENYNIKDSKEIEIKFNRNNKGKENIILDKNIMKFINFLNNVKELLEKQFTNIYNLIIKLIFKLEDNYPDSNDLYDISCKYYFYPPIQDNEISPFYDENILVNGINGNCQGFYYLINEINEYDYINIEFKKYLNIEKIVKEKDKIEEKKQIEIEKEKEKRNKSEKFLSLYDKGNLYYKIIEKQKTIINNKEEEEYLGPKVFIKQLKNDYFVIGGNSNIIFIFDNNFTKLKEIYLNCKVRYISEKNYEQNKDLIKIIVCCDENIILISYNINENNYTDYYLDVTSSYFCFEISDDYYILSNAKGTYIYRNLFSQTNEKELIKKIKYSYKAGIQINKDLIALVSNSIMPNGMDNLIIYNLNSNRIELEINGYSFNLNMNSLLLMEKYLSSNDEKLLICACKKYSNNQNNGILLVNANIYENDEIFSPFYKTYSFEPNCFCEILNIHNDKEEKKYKTNYFLVGGFDTLKGIGQIKLCKIKYDYNIYNTTIEIILDIIVDNLNLFNGTINCIIQSKYKGNLLISCSNGNIYLFSPPNINYFLFYEEERNGKEYKEMNLYDNQIEDKNKKDEKNKEEEINIQEKFKKILKIYNKKK